MEEQMIKNHKILHVMSSESYVDIRDFINDNKLQKEDILKILSHNNKIVLYYYYGGIK